MAFCKRHSAFINAAPCTTMYAITEGAGTALLTGIYFFVCVHELRSARRQEDVHIGHTDSVL